MRIFILAIAVLYGFVGLTSTSAQLKAAESEVLLKTILQRAWDSCGYPVGNGGFTALIKTSKGETFASTLSDASPNSHFRAASVTKTTTAASIMLLEQRGMLKIDDLVTEVIPGRNETYLPETLDYAIPNKSTMTIKLLLQHRAGVFDAANDMVPARIEAPFAGKVFVQWQSEIEPDHQYTLDELVGIVARYKLSIAKPGAIYHYSNTGYSLLGKIIERVSGKSLDRFLMDEFIIPLKMEHTHFVTKGTSTVPPEPFIAGWTKAEGQFYDSNKDNSSYAIAEGNMVTTFADLAVWMRALFHGEAGLSSGTVARMCEIVPIEGISGYGLGVSNSPPELGYGHNGGIRGYFTLARYEPESDFTIILLSSMIDADDLKGQANVIYKVAIEAKNALASGQMVM